MARTDQRRSGRGAPPPASAALEPDRELLHFNVRLAKQRQGLVDAHRIERRAFREHARVENAVAAYTRELAALLRQRGFSRVRPRPLLPAQLGEAVLVVQLSDLHFNERVELPSNRYDFTVAAARLAKLAGLSAPAQAARCTAEQAPAEQAAGAGETQVAGFLMNE